MNIDRIKTLQSALRVRGHDINVDGSLGSLTLEAMIAELAKPGAVDVDADPNDVLLAEELLRDEGFVSHAYQDSRGFWTIGIGRLIDKRKGGGITREEALYLKANDVVRFKRELAAKAPWYLNLDPVRRRVMLNMTFNMGVGWLDSFKNTVANIRAGKYEAAAVGMENSAWASQVGIRAKRLASMMRTGRA